MKVGAHIRLRWCVVTLSQRSSYSGTFSELHPQLLLAYLHRLFLCTTVAGDWATRAAGGGYWAIFASGKTTYNGKDYGLLYRIKEEPAGLRRGDGWLTAPVSTRDLLVWTKDGQTDITWIRSKGLKLRQGR